MKTRKGSRERHCRRTTGQTRHSFQNSVVERPETTVKATDHLLVHMTLPPTDAKKNQGDTQELDMLSAEVTAIIVYYAFSWLVSETNQEWEHVRAIGIVKNFWIIETDGGGMLVINVLDASPRVSFFLAQREERVT